MFTKYPSPAIALKLDDCTDCHDVPPPPLVAAGAELIHDSVAALYVNNSPSAGVPVIVTSDKSSKAPATPLAPSEPV